MLFIHILYVGNPLIKLYPRDELVGSREFEIAGRNVCNAESSKERSGSEPERKEKHYLTARFIYSSQSYLIYIKVM